MKMNYVKILDVVMFKKIQKVEEKYGVKFDALIVGEDERLYGNLDNLEL